MVPSAYWYDNPYMTSNTCNTSGDELPLVNIGAHSRRSAFTDYLIIPNLRDSPPNFNIHLYYPIRRNNICSEARGSEDNQTPEKQKQISVNINPLVGIVFGPESQTSRSIIPTTIPCGRLFVVDHRCLYPPYPSYFRLDFFSAPGDYLTATSLLCSLGADRTRIIPTFWSC